MTKRPGKPAGFATVGASIGAVGASVCWVGPRALVLLGVSGAWIGNLTALDPWRPWLSDAALLSLGLAFWSRYGPPSRCRAEGQCVDPGTLKRRRRWLWLATIVIALLLLFPYYVVWFL